MFVASRNSRQGKIVPSSHETAEIAISRVRGVTCSRINSKIVACLDTAGLGDPKSRPRCQQRAGETEMLGVGGCHLIARRGDRAR